MYRKQKYQKRRITALYCIDDEYKVVITDRMICFESIIVIVLQLLVNTKNNDNHVDVLNILIQLRVVSCIKVIFIILWFCINIFTTMIELSRIILFN